MSVQSVLNTTAATTTTENKSLNSLGKQEFLKILMTQLKYQNPLDPLEPDDFLTQLSQLTQVEQITNIAETLNKMNENSAASGLAQWLSAVGKKVDVGSTTLSYGDEVAINPSGDYDKIYVQVKDSNNNIVDEATFSKGDTLAFTYSGTSEATISVTGVKNGRSVPCSYTVFNTVAGVETGSNGPMVVLNNGNTYAVANIKQIKG